MKKKLTKVICFILVCSFLIPSLPSIAIDLEPDFNYIIEDTMKSVWEESEELEFMAMQKGIEREVKAMNEFERDVEVLREELIKGRRLIDKDKLAGNINTSSMDTIFKETQDIQLTRNTESKIISISAGLDDFHFLRDDGTVWYYSNNDYGQIYGLDNIVSIESGGITI